MFALNLIRMFEKNGKRAGQDYGIMGYDNIDFLEYVTPRLTTIDNHVEKVAEEAFNLLLQLMETKCCRNRENFGNSDSTGRNDIIK